MFLVMSINIENLRNCYVKLWTWSSFLLQMIFMDLKNSSRQINFSHLLCLPLFT